MSNPNIYYEGREVKFKIKKIGKVIFPKRAIKAGDFAILSVYPLDNEDGQIYVHPTWGNCTVKGKVPQLVDGEEYEIIATEVPQDPKYGQGWQYNIIKMSSPSSKQLKDNSEGRTFLKAIFTDNQYAMLTSIDNPIELLERGDSTELSKIKGIGKTTANKMISKYNSLKECSGDVLAFAKLDLTDNEVKTIMEYYNDNSTIAIQSIKDNPYCLTDIKGFGFKKVDDIALRNGLVGEHDKRRVKAYIEYLFEDMGQNDGSTWTWTDNVFDCVMSNLEIEDEELIAQSLRELVEEKKLWTNKEHSKLGLKKYRDMEENIAKELIRLMKAKPRVEPLTNWKGLVKQTEQEQGFNFTKEQYNGIVNNLNNNVVATFARAGAGKSSAVNGTLNCFPEDTKILQVALSGKASDNLKNITGKESMTIHRALKWNPEHGGFAYNKKNPLDIDILILEEVGMCSLSVMLPLLEATPNGCRIYMLGDIAQIPCINAGAILRDIINSEVIPTNHYTKVMRQGDESRIKPVSYDIADGKQIFQEKGEYVLDEGDLKEIIINNKEDIPNIAMNEYVDYINQGVNKEDIVILCPIKNKGENSCYWYNNEIQKIWHNETKEKYIVAGQGEFKFKLFVGDRILNKRNNYKTKKYGINYSGMTDKEIELNCTAIFNGMTGTVIELSDKGVAVEFDCGERVILEKEQLLNTTLGYSFSVHVSQGQTIPYTIFTLDYGAYSLLNRNIIYTGLTRAKYKCSLIAQRSALKYGISQSEVNNRNTFLENDLKYLSRGSKNGVNK
ncbi:ATP-dependent RecD-like DNA helicase [Clostridium sp.]|uniref:ATP-dependent DNA helicase n=1 Tax=Clostridium sp. TaxID=1506 RepID=UPI0025BDED16|nr:ATP-dependent RecD-like DNA helicase [Clostridium sp.]